MSILHRDLVIETPTFTSAGLKIEKSGKHFVIARTTNNQRQRWELYPFIGPLPEGSLKYRRGAYTFKYNLPA
jgi:hypothetical protein